MSTAGAGVADAESRKLLKGKAISLGISLASSSVRSIVTARRKGQVNRIRTASVAVLLASFVGAVPPVQAGDQGRRDRVEDRWDRRDDRRDRKDDRRDRKDDRRDRREDRRDYRDDVRDARREYEEDLRDARREYYEDVRDARRDYWDAARYYRHDDRRYRPRRLGRQDVVYRGSDNRYYCRRDDGTTGLIIGGMSGGVLGHIIAPGGSKTLGTIIGAGAGALIGKAIDDGDVVCR
jgi:hypothetical protein